MPLFDQVYIKSSNILKYFDLKNIYILIVQSSVSHGPSEIILICRFDPQKHFLSLSISKTAIQYVYFFI